MPPKTNKSGKSDKGKQPTKTKPTSSGSGGKAKKKKWSKGKVRDKLNNACLFDQVTYDKLYKEVPSYKVITPSIVSERLKIRVSLARHGLIELLGKGLIRSACSHNMQEIYTRPVKAE